MFYYNVKFVLPLYDIKGHTWGKQFLNSKLERSLYHFPITFEEFPTPFKNFF